MIYFYFIRESIKKYSFLIVISELTVSSSSSEKGSKFKIHAVQILPLKSFKSHMFSRYMELSANSNVTHKFAVQVCID